MLYDVTEELDHTKLYKIYSTIGRNPAILPESMFRILIYGYMEGIYSSRDLEKVCKRDINITIREGILLRMNRSIQVEGAFGVIKEDFGFRRFFMRGNIKVRTEFLLMAFGYNVNKLHNKTLQKHNGKLLHKQWSS